MMTDTDVKKVAEGKVEVTLEKVHTHAGRVLQPGNKITVARSEAQFLLQHKVIKSIPAV